MVALLILYMALTSFAMLLTPVAKMVRVSYVGAVTRNMSVTLKGYETLYELQYSQV